MFSSAVFASLGLIGAVNAATDPRVPILPLNSQIGAAKFGFGCNIPFLGIQYFPGFVGGTAPSAIQPGQPYALTDASAQVNVSSLYSWLAAIVGVTRANVTVSNVILYDYSGNQSPGSINALKKPLVIDGIPVTAGDDIIVKVPKAPATITTPAFTVNAAAGATAVTAYGGVNLTITLLNSNNSVFLFPIPINCVAPSTPLIVSTLNVRGARNTTLNDIQNGKQDSFPDVPINFQVGSFRYPVTCDFPGVGSFNIDQTISGTLPVYVSSGAPFSIVNATGAIRFSSSVIAGIKSAYPGASSFTGSVTEFILSGTNTVEGSINLASTPIPISTPVPLTGVASLGGGQLLVVPQNIKKTLTGTLTTKTISKNGTLTAIAVGKSGATINILDSSGSDLGTIFVSCANPGISLVVVPIVA